MEPQLPAELSAAIDSMAVGYVVLDRAWRITHINAAAEPILGRPAAELVGQNLWAMFPGARELEFGVVYERVMSTRRPAAFEAFYPGLAIWFELRVQPNGTGIAVYFLDVTARHDAQAMAEAAGERLALLTRVSDVLTGSEDPDVALGRLASLLVPQLADWTVVTVIDEDGRFRDVGWAHRDASRAAEVAAYRAIQSTMKDVSPAATGLRTGQSVIIAQLSDDALEAALDDPAARNIVKRLEPHGVAIMPLTARGRTLGMLALVTTRQRGSHTEQEISMALEVARRAGPVLDSARSAARAKRLAESLQLSLLDVARPAPGLEIAVRYRPAYDDRRVGGDWYDSFVLPDGSSSIAIGDVMGHDLAAIAAMAQLRTMMRTAAWTLLHSPAGVLTATDEASFGLGPAIFATALTAQLSPAAPDGSVQMRWSNAGHPPPILITPDARITALGTVVTDPPLGVVRGLDRRNHALTLQPGSVVLLYTDGLFERRDRDLELGLTELARVLATVADADLDTMLDTMLAELTAGHAHNDDVAMIAVRVVAPPR